MAESQGKAATALLNQLAGNAVMRQLLILVGIAASVALGVAAVLWSQGPDYRSLYTGLAPDRAAAVVDVLSAANIPYQVSDGTGAIKVPAEQLHDARLKLAGQGVMRDGSGMAMLEQEQGFGVSEFMQSKKYHYALEQELAKTIESIQQVRKARVHLAIPKQSVFVRDRKPPSASIMLDVYPGSRIQRNSVDAIVNLVATSISGMSAEDVTVVDQLGKQLSQKEDNSDQLSHSARQFDYQRRIEKAYEDRVAELIRPFAGSGRVRVQVAADVDFSTVQESRESWNPDKQVVRSEQINEQVPGEGNANTASGVPGALSNQPPLAGTESAKTDKDANGSRSVVRNYEIERVLNHTVNPSGMIRRLSVAVVVDNRRVLNDAGELVSDPISEAEINQLSQLVKDAVGFEDGRGDRVTVMSADFRDDLSVEETVSGPGFWEQPWFASLVKQGLAGLAVLFIVFAILRPGMRSLMAANQPRSVPALPGGEEGLQGEYMQPAMAALAGPGSAGFEQKMGDVRAAAEQDPRRVAQVVKKWVSENGES
ncbi:flagellar basal-body M-ring protein/flagellar hook-basal body protein FliF [Spongiibacter sp. IMCC21906]|uniref:flagellar basal-body MS-ring/collar protein FliF n=1 Tax=Spongiibacter sp. IMCC21906 TaxID=1620392 RepID=UPI00062DCAFD|nr:flagellar basal-body MS-ring/collar protein FliF [Spongiibacter sp. IMCC21906]AKH69409.1 flagellar basal-body M-ring protein/flagellar hook-basal body protein FliF [Spongiibacter sp. IMCC21906]